MCVGVIGLWLINKLVVMEETSMQHGNNSELVEENEALKLKI
jgi:hypothetical protein